MMGLSSMVIWESHWPAFIVFPLALHEGGYSFAAFLSEEPGSLGTVDDFFGGPYLASLEGVGGSR
jgi:hypothetical protein